VIPFDVEDCAYANQIRVWEIPPGVCQIFPPGLLCSVVPRL